MNWSTIRHMCYGAMIAFLLLAFAMRAEHKNVQQYEELYALSQRAVKQTQRCLALLDVLQSKRLCSVPYRDINYD